MNTQKQRLLFVDDEPSLLRAIKRMAHKWPWQIETCTSGAEAIEKITQQDYACIVSDMCMPGVSGIDVLSHALTCKPDTPRILLSGLSSLQDAVEAVNICRIDQFLIKPCEATDLYACLDRHIKHYQLISENKDLHNTIQDQNRSLKQLNKKLLNNIEEKHKSMLMSWKIQSSLLIDSIPKQLFYSQICCYTIPAQELNGDFILFHKYNDHYYDVVVGDVMGKGISAALQGAAIKSAFQFEWGRQSQGAKDDIKTILQHVAENTAAEISLINSFVSMFYCRINTKDAKIEYIDCGSTKPLLISSVEDHKKLSGKNLPLGITGMADDYNVEQHTINPEDIMVLYSDGIVEAASQHSQDMFGEKRLEHVIAEHRMKSAQQIGNTIQRCVRQFSGKSGHLDDFTVVVIKFTEDQDLDATKRIYKQQEIELFTGMSKEKFARAIEMQQLTSALQDRLWDLYTFISQAHYNDDEGLPIWLTIHKEHQQLQAQFYDYGQSSSEDSYPDTSLTLYHDVDPLARNCTACLLDMP